MKHVLRWQNVTIHFAGRISNYPVVNEIDSYYRGELLSRILDMQKQMPISLEAAIHLLTKHEQEASDAGRKGTEPGHLFWYAWHFVEWIESLGYHIELTGDEFEAIGLSDRLH